MIDWTLLFSTQFWFGFGWNPLQAGTAAFMAVVFSAIVAAGILLKVLPKRAPTADPPLVRALARGGTVCITTGILGAFLTFTAYEQAGFLAARFWFLALFLSFLGWSGWTAWQAHILVPAEREAASIRAKLRRYFSKKRK